MEAQCPFYNKSIGDVKLILKSVIENHLFNRQLTMPEVEKMAVAFSDAMEAAISKHALTCPLRDDVKDNRGNIIQVSAKQAGAEAERMALQEEAVHMSAKLANNWNTVYRIVAILIAVLGFVITLYKVVYVPIKAGQQTREPGVELRVPIAPEIEVEK